MECIFVLKPSFIQLSCLLEPEPIASACKEEGGLRRKPRVPNCQSPEKSLDERDAFTCVKVRHDR